MINVIDTEIFSCLFQLSGDIGYVLYSALGSFYIPSCIMVFVYIRIYFAAKARARRGIKKKPHKRNEQVSVQTLHFSNFIDWSDRHARESFAKRVYSLRVMEAARDSTCDMWRATTYWLLGTLYYRHATCRFVSILFSSILARIFCEFVANRIRSLYICIVLYVSYGAMGCERLADRVPCVMLKCVLYGTYGISTR